MATQLSCAASDECGAAKQLFFGGVDVEIAQVNGAPVLTQGLQFYWLG